MCMWDQWLRRTRRPRPINSSTHFTVFLPRTTAPAPPLTVARRLYWPSSSPQNGDRRLLEGACPTAPATPLANPSFSLDSNGAEAAASAVQMSEGRRHGFVASLDLNRLEAVVWEPVTGSQHHIPFPPEFHQKKRVYHGAVLSSAASDSHLNSFKLVLAHIGSGYKLVSVCLYESESGKWGKITSAALLCATLFYRPAIMVGNAVYWLLYSCNIILQFDLDGQSLAVIKTPEDIHVTGYSHILTVAHDNKLSLAILSKLSIQFLERLIWMASTDGCYGKLSNHASSFLR